MKAAPISERNQSMTIYDELARLLAYHENAAETVRAQLRVLGRGQDDRAQARGLGAAVQRSGVIAARDLDPDRRAASGLSQATIERRARTAAVLAQFDPREPKRAADLTDQAMPLAGLGSLVRRGYLRAEAGGFVRTDKPFFVHPNEPSARAPR